MRWWRPMPPRRREIKTSFGRCMTGCIATKTNGPNLGDPRPTFVGYARQLILKVEQFTSDMDSNLVDQRITADVQRGTAAGSPEPPRFSSTPTCCRTRLRIPKASAGHQHNADPEGRALAGSSRASGRPEGPT